jgi:hypothetical protein
LYTVWRKWNEEQDKERSSDPPDASHRGDANAKRAVRESV